MNGLWRNWMIIWCWAVMIFGLVLIGAAFPATEAPIRLLLEVEGGRGPIDFDPPLRFSLSLCGAITLGWGMTLLAAVRASERLTRTDWRRITGAVLIWYVVDSVLSVATGFGLNAVSNTLFLIGYLIPLFASGALGQGRPMVFTPSAHM